MLVVIFAKARFKVQYDFEKAKQKTNKKIYLDIVYVVCGL